MEGLRKSLSIEAARLLAARSVLPRSANRSSCFKTRPRNLNTEQIRPGPRFLIGQKDISTTAHQEQFAGLKWVPDLDCELVPKWTIEPDLEKIKQVASEALSSKEISVTFFHEGEQNKLYNVRVGEDDFIMRLSLPVDPRWKTLSEVATVKWAHRNTHLRVPHIFAYDASQKNSIGFEWILMSKLPGKPLVDVWNTMQFPAKKKLVQELAIYSSAMFKKQLHGIGNIYLDSTTEGKDGENVDNDNLPEVKRIVSKEFYWGPRVLHSIPRGPFCSSKDWIAARLASCEQDCHLTFSRLYEAIVRKKDFDTDEDSDAFLVAGSWSKMIGRLKPLLNGIFPSGDPELEPSMLIHGDLTMENILVDDAGALIGVANWECVSALPLWKACDYPSFLYGVGGRSTAPRLTEPKLDYYRDYYREDEDAYDLSNPNCLYYGDLSEYERTILRKYFLDEMRRLEPDWMQVFESSTSKLKRDFHIAAELSGTMYYMSLVDSWIDGMTSGMANPPSLQDMFSSLELSSRDCEPEE